MAYPSPASTRQNAWGGTDVNRLIGKREIMRYLGIRSQPTWTRYKRMGLPVIWTISNHVVANAHEIDAWLRRVGRPKRDRFPLPLG